MSLPLNRIKLTGVCLLLLPSVVTAAQACLPITSISATTAHLTDNNNGIISDPNRELEWKKCSEGQMFMSAGNTCVGLATELNWGAALTQAQTVNTATGGENLGQTDWRVPTIKELNSIVEESCINPAIGATVFPETMDSEYWSSSKIASGDSAWAINFSTGDDMDDQNKSNLNYVRLVRSGQ